MLNQTYYLRRYGVAIASVVIVLLLMLALDPVLQLIQASFFLFTGAVAISALYGGRSSGIVATLLSAVFANYYFVEPKYSLSLTLASGLRLALFILQGILLSLLIESFRAAQERFRQTLKQIKATEAEIQDLNQSLQRQVDELQTLTAAKLAFEDRYQVLFESIDEGFCFCKMLLNKDGTPVDYQILEANSVFEPLTGLAQAVGKTVRELIPDLEDVWFETYGRVAVNREPIRFEQHSMVMNRWFDVYAFPIGEPQSYLFGILFTNITARKTAERERERFLVVGSDLQVITGSNGYFQWVSPTFEPVLGWTVEEMTSRPWIEFLHPDDIDKSTVETERLFSSNETLAFENRYRHKDGSYRWLLWKAQSDMEQQVIYGAAVDITDRKRHEANAAFLAAIAAEFSHLSTSQDIIQTVGAKLGAYLDLATCHFVEIDEAADQSSVSQCWRTPDAPEFSGIYRISQFLTPEIYGSLHVSEPVAVDDTQNDSRVYAEAYAAIGIMGFVTVPFLQSGEWRYLFSVTTLQVRHWRNDEIELIQEVSNRLFLSLERARAEHALRESEERFRTLSATIPQLLWTTRPDGSVDYLSEQWTDYTGLPRSQLYDWNWLQVVHPDDVPNTSRDWNHGLQLAEPVRLQQRLRYHTGEWRWHVAHGVPIKDSSGQVTKWVGTCTDIQSEMDIRAALQEREEQICNILESINDGFFALNQDWRFTYMNQAAEQILDRIPNDLVGKVIWDEYPGLLGTEFERVYAEAMGDRKAGSVTAFYPDHDCWYTVHAYPATQGITIYFRNVTVQVQAEAALRQSEERLRLAMEAAQMGMWDVNLNTGNAIWTEQHFTMLGYEPIATGAASEEMWSSRIHPDDLEGVLQAWQQSRLEQQLYRSEYRVIRADNGQIAWIAALGSFMYDQTGQAVRSIGVVFDISDRRQAEASILTLNQQLQEKITELETLLEVIPIGIGIAEDRECRYIRVNPAFARLLNIPPTVNASLTAPEEERPTFFKVYRNGQEMLPEELPLQYAAKHGVEVRELEVEVIWQDGTIVSLLEYAAPLFDGSAQPRGSVGAFLDITNRKQAEASLRESETRFRTLADNISQFAWMADEQGSLFWYNQRWFDYTGTTLEEMQGWGWQQVHHPDYIDRVVSKFRQHIEAGEIWEDTFPLRGKDGQYRWFLSRAIPMRDQQGRVYRWFGTNTDITNLRQTELALRQTTERLNVALKSAPITLFNQDLDLRYIWIHNPTHDYTIDEVIGKRDEDLLSSDTTMILTQLKQQVLNTGVGLRGEVKVSRDGQTDYYYDLTIDPIQNSENIILGITCAAVDITQRKQIEAERERLLQREQIAREEAERANRIKDEFLAILSHELRSPLNPILGWAKLLQTRQFDAAKTAEALATIERNARLQTQLIDDLLDIAKILRGKLTLEMATVDLVFVIEAAIDTVRSAATVKNIVLHPVLSQIGQVSGDATRLQQITWNLLSNAIKFTPKNGRIDIRLERVDEQAQLTISDTGKGIKPDFLPHIFELFRQEDASTTRRFGGLGLGLAIVRQLVEAHGGTITADSPGEGLGATFTIRLPLLEIGQESQQPETVFGQYPNLSNMRVLIVDDEPDARELLAVILTQYGAEVMTVTSAVEVLNNLESFQPDVLISDIGMPDMDGYCLIRQIRALPSEKGGQVPAIALTAYARGEDYEQAIANGYQCHVTKPFDQEQLVQAVLSLTRL